MRNNRHELRGLDGVQREASPFFAHSRKNLGAGADLTSSLSPTLVSNFKVNFIRHEFTIEQYGDFFDITRLGSRRRWAINWRASFSPALR